MQSLLQFQRGTLTVMNAARVFGMQLLATAFCFAGWGMPAAIAQSPVGDSLYTVGTTAVDAQGRTWAYILWQASSDGLVIGKKFSVNSKPGLATDPLDYERQGIAVVQTDPQSIGILLQRGEWLGDDLAQLEDRIDQLFVGLAPGEDVSLAEKLSIVIRGSLGDLERFGNLVMLGRLHPSVNLCIGYAFAVRIPGFGSTTFEIRNYDLASDLDMGVVGRVTLNPASPVVLPAPDAPVQVPEYPAGSAKGDLNVKLRWSTAAPLRRLALLNYGFNVYRMTKIFTEGDGYHITPPSATKLSQLLIAEDEVIQVNTLPVLKTRDFSSLDIADFVADPKTVFIADDNGRYKEGGVAFENGSQYYYFVAARDILGRIGAVSDGLMVTLCDRLPSDAPRRLEVVNDYSYDGTNNKQVLKISWEQHNNPEQDTVVAYYVYRWSSPSEVQVNGSNPLVNQIAGPITPIPGKRNFYVDDGAGAPQSPADYGKTFWYTVRAVDDGACNGGNYSAHSAPAFGVLRDRAGPASPLGGVFVICCEPFVKGLDSVDEKDPKGDQQRDDLMYYMLTCERRDIRIRWAEFYLHAPTADNYLGRVHFKPGEKVARMPWVASRGKQVGEVPFYCRVGSKNGKVSQLADVQTVRAPSFGNIRVVPFESFTECRRVPFAFDSQSDNPNDKTPGATTDPNSEMTVTGRKDPCRGHYPNPPDGSGSPDDEGIEVLVQLTPGTKEFKLYRRVDFGPLTLIGQGEADFEDVAQITFEDTNMPANSAVICYYGQLFDEHGNASPLILLSDCIPVIQPAAKPMLMQLESVGNEDEPQMRIRWFCPPYGIKRFEVSVANDLGMVANEISDQLSSQIAGSPQIKTYTIEGVAHENSFALFHTSLVGPGFGNGAIFEVTVNIALGQEYTVMVAAVDKAEEVNTDSNAEMFIWHEKAPGVGPDVPWPARPLPSLNQFHPRIAALQLPDSIYPGVGISIGEFTGVRWVQRYEDITVIDPNRDQRTDEQFPQTDPVGLNINSTVGLISQIPNLNVLGVNDQPVLDFGQIDALYDIIGDLVVPSQPKEALSSLTLRPHLDPHFLLYNNKVGEILFPVVVYRTQIPNEFYPEVSGDLIQVTPLMEEIAYDWTADKKEGDVTEIRDPFLTATPPVNFDKHSVPGFIFLKDTQPVVEGARYIYLLTRFSENGEIKEIVPTNAVTITPSQ